MPPKVGELYFLEKQKKGNHKEKGDYLAWLEPSCLTKYQKTNSDLITAQYEGSSFTNRCWEEIAQE